MKNHLNQHLNHPTDWDGIVNWDGPAHELDYAMVWDDGNQGAHLIVIFHSFQIFHQT
jgi:hypothetical protein